jgi:mRNA interferase MazF
MTLSEAVRSLPAPPNLARVHPFQVVLRKSDTGLPVDAKAQAEQIRPVAVERVGARVGTVPPAVMNALDEALRLHLSL